MSVLQTSVAVRASLDSYFNLSLMEVSSCLILDETSFRDAITWDERKPVIEGDDAEGRKRWREIMDSSFGRISFRDDLLSGRAIYSLALPLGAHLTRASR